LPLRKLCAIDECLPGSEGRDRDGSCLSMVKRGRLRRDVGGNGQAIVRLGTVDEPIAQAIDKIPDLDTHASRSDRVDDTGEFVAKNNGKRSGAAFRSMEGGIPRELRRRDRGGMDPNEHLIALRTGFRCILIEKCFRPTNLMQPYRPHLDGLIARRYFSISNPSLCHQRQPPSSSITG
jgi:hypothetical protein